MPDYTSRGFPNDLSDNDNSYNSEYSNSDCQNRYDRSKYLKYYDR
jgi:hypothetical protein